MNDFLDDLRKIENQTSVIFTEFDSDTEHELLKNISYLDILNLFESELSDSSKYPKMRTRSSKVKFFYFYAESFY